MRADDQRSLNIPRVTLERKSIKFLQISAKQMEMIEGENPKQRTDWFCLLVSPSKFQRMTFFFVSIIFFISTNTNILTTTLFVDFGDNKLRKLRLFSKKRVYESFFYSPLPSKLPVRVTPKRDFAIGTIQLNVLFHGLRLNFCDGPFLTEPLNGQYLLFHKSFLSYFFFNFFLTLP